MFAIKVNDTFLDLQLDHDFEVTRKARMFEKSHAGVFTELPLQVPNTKTNRRAFGLWDQFDNLSYKKEYPAELWGNDRRHTGRVKIIRSNPDQFEFYFLGDQSYFFSQAKEIKLTEIPYFEKFSEGKTISGYDHEVIDQTFLNDISSYVAKYPAKNFVFFPTYMPRIKEEPNESYGTINQLHYINSFDHDRMKFACEESDNPLLSTYFSYIGYFYLAFVVSKIAEHLGYTLERNVLEEDPEFSQLVLFNENFHHIYNDTYRDEHPELEEGACYMSFERDLPDMPAADLLKHIENRFNCEIQVDEYTKTIKVESVEGRFSGNRIVPLDDYVSGSIRHFEKETRGFALKTEIPNEENYFDENGVEDQYQSGNKPFKEITTKLCPLTMHLSERDRMPYIPRSDAERPGATVTQAYPFNDDHPRILLYRGMVPLDLIILDEVGSYKHLGYVDTFENIPNYNNGSPLSSNPSGYLYGNSLPRYRITRTGATSMEVEVFDYIHTIDRVHFSLKATGDTYESTDTFYHTFTIDLSSTSTEVIIVIDTPENSFTVSRHVGYNTENELAVGEYIEGGYDKKLYTRILVLDEMKTYRWEKINTTPEFYWVQWEDNADWIFSQNAYPFASSNSKIYLSGTTQEKYNKSLWFVDGVKGLVTTSWSLFKTWLLGRDEQGEIDLITMESLSLNQIYSIGSIHFLIEELRETFVKNYKKVRAKIRRI